MTTLYTTDEAHAFPDTFLLSFTIFFENDSTVRLFGEAVENFAALAVLRRCTSADVEESGRSVSFHASFLISPDVHLGDVSRCVWALDGQW